MVDGGPHPWNILVINSLLVLCGAAAARVIGEKVRGELKAPVQQIKPAAAAIEKPIKELLK